MVKDANNSEEIAGVLDALLADAASRDTMGRNAQRRVHEEFLVFTQMRRWLETFHQILS